MGPAPSLVGMGPALALVELGPATTLVELGPAPSLVGIRSAPSLVEYLTGYSVYLTNTGARGCGSDQEVVELGGGERSGLSE